MRPPLLTAVTILSLLPSAAAFLTYIYRWLAVDSCLDRGGIYDYVSHVCRYDVLSLSVGPLVSSSIVFLCVAVSVVAPVAFFWRYRAHAH